jgi:maltose O-acetyltransferase
VAHPTEKDKMLAGQLYRSGDAMLRSERKHARRLQKAFNDTLTDEIEKRAAILAELLGALGMNAEIEPPFFCDYGYNIHAGDNFYANFNGIFLDCAPITIGDNVFLGPNVQLYTATHPLAVEERDKGLESAKPIVIEDSVWICGGVIINPGITIGRGTTIGAGSVVTRDIPPDVFAAGNPCKVIRKLVLPQ